MNENRIDKGNILLYCTRPRRELTADSNGGEFSSKSTAGLPSDTRDGGDDDDDDGDGDGAQRTATAR